MDIREIKKLILKYRQALVANNILPDMIILFGSYAKGNFRQDSDIDIAVISNDFHDNDFDEKVLLNKISAKIDSRIQATSFSVKKYLSKNSASPLLDEIKKTGTLLF